jgi:hypothetical protein
LGCAIVINVTAPKGHGRAVVAEMADVIMDETSDVGRSVETVLEGALEMLA